jgi:DNA-binding NarL/FixJ family response regulator
VKSLKTIAICHGNQLLAECLKYTLSRNSSHQCHLLDCCCPAADAIAADLLVIDGALPTADIEGLIVCTRRSNHACRVLLVVSRHAAHQMIQLTRLGADGCLFDQSSVEELHTAIEALLRGEQYCSMQVANALFSQLGQSNVDQKWSQHIDNVRLTAREREILELIAWEKLGNKQIARRLSISLYTVKNHIHNIIEKLGVDDRHAAADMATRRMMLSAR